MCVDDVIELSYDVSVSLNSYPSIVRTFPVYSGEVIIHKHGYFICVYLENFRSAARGLRKIYTKHRSMFIKSMWMDCHHILLQLEQAELKATLQTITQNQPLHWKMMTF